MNRAEYLEALSNALGDMSYADVKDINSEINEHFDIGLSQGKTEEHIAEALGDPEGLAKLYKEGCSATVAIKRNRTKNPNSVITKPVKKAHAKDPSAGKLFVIFFNIFAGVPFYAIYSFVMAVFGGAFISLIINFAAYCGDVSGFGNFVNSGTCFAVAVGFLIIFLACLFYFAVKFYIRNVTRYIKWNRRIWNEGF